VRKGTGGRDRLAVASPSIDGRAATRWRSSPATSEHNHSFYSRAGATAVNRAFLGPRRRASSVRKFHSRPRPCLALHVWMAPGWQEEMQRAAQKSLAVMCPARKLQAHCRGRLSRHSGGLVFLLAQHHRPGNARPLLLAGAVHHFALIVLAVLRAQVICCCCCTLTAQPSPLTPATRHCTKHKVQQQHKERELRPVAPCSLLRTTALTGNA
jgi:hypothetical protein